MKKLSVSLIAVVAIIFAVASAFTTAKTSTMYKIYGTLVANQPSNPSDATWYPANGSFVSEQSFQHTSIQLDEIKDANCDLSQRICLAEIKVDDGVVDANFPAVTRQGDFVQ